MKYASQRAAEASPLSLVHAAHLSDILESSGDAIISKSDDGTILSWNSAAERMFGYSAREVVGRSIRIIIPDSRLAEEESIAESVNHGHAVGPIESVRIRKDGAPVEISLTVSPIFNQSKKVIGAFKVARNVSEQKKLSDEIRARERRYQTVLEGMNAGFWDWDVTANKSYWSPRCLEIIGMGPEEVVPNMGEFESRLHPEDRERTLALLTDHVQGKCPFNVEYRLMKKDGSYVWVHATGQSTYDANGKAIRVVGSLQDISWRKQTELLNESVIENAPYAMVMVGVEGKILMANRQTELLFGYTREELVDTPMERLVPRRFRDGHAHHLRNYISDPTSRAMGVGRDLFALRKNGTEFPVEIRLNPILGEPGLKILAAIVDITARKTAENINKSVIENAPYAIVMADAWGTILLANRQTELLFGYARDELVGTPVHRLVPERLQGRHGDHLRSYVSDPTSRAMGVGRDLFALRKDGTEFPVEIRLNPLSSERGLQILSAIVDITERKKAEEKLRFANRELEEFAYAASHDLKAPLRVIDNASKWLEEDLEPTLTPDTRENMKLLRGRVKRMEKLLDDLLAYSRIATAPENQELDLVPGNILMDNVLGLLSIPDGFKISVDSAFGGILVSRMPLQQILFNLVNNAIKHHDKPAGTIEVQVRSRGGFFEFLVRDDGPGIATKYHDVVFKMFQTLKPRDQVEGSGIGLAMVRKSIELHGGTIRLESDEGQGCTFRFTWPAAIPQSGKTNE